MTAQPISWVIRQNDSREEWVEEICDSQQRLNRHLKRITNNNKVWAKKAGKESVNEGAPFGTDIEYEVDQSNIVPNYWLRIDWDAALERRAALSPKLDVPANFIGAELSSNEVHHHEDCRLLLNPKYHALIRSLDEITNHQW